MLSPTSSAGSRNAEIAARLEEIAALLSQQGANPFRVRAYERAAETVVRLEADVTELAAEGRDALMSLPHVGRGIAAVIHELARTGRSSQLERLRGELDPVAVFATIPGVGPTLAASIHDELQVDTLEALEAAAHDGRLETVEGIGSRRAAAIRAVLAERLGRPRPWPRPGASPRPAAPGIAAILDADREYRHKAARGELPTIAPRRFNPDRQAWLPVLHTVRERWHMTLLFSNTARAHELGRTRDWVVVYYYDGDHQEGQCTVVTETHGPRTGRRVVRGREDEGSGAATTSDR